MLVNPSDAGSLLRIANRPRRGIGDTSLARVVTHADTTGRTLWDALADPEAAGVDLGRLPRDRRGSAPRWSR